MKRVMLCLLALVLAGSLVVGSPMANPIPVMAASATFECKGAPGVTIEKEDITVGIAVAGVVCTVAAFFGWIFGVGLQVHALAHILAEKVANDKSPMNYQYDPNRQAHVIPSDLTLPRNQTDSPDLSESLNQMGNEAINSDLAVTSLCLALATATNRYYTAQAEGDVASMEMQLGDIQTFLSDLRLAEVEAAGELMAFATALASEGPDPTITQEQFAYFQNNVSTSGLPQEEVDLFNSFVAKMDPILFEGFDYVGYLESLVTSVTFLLPEQTVSNATMEIAEAMQYTSQVIGPFPEEGGVGGIVEFPEIEEPGAVTPDLSDHNYGALAGVIVGAIVGTIMLISAVWYVRRRRTKAI